MAKKVLHRKISFPLDAVFQSSVQDGDNVELWRLLVTNKHEDAAITGSHGPCDHDTLIPVTLDLNRPSHVGVTALHQSVLNNNMDATKMLLTHGADVNLPDVNGFTPLHTAAACGFLNLVSLLLIFGADIFATTGDGDLPVDVAKNHGVAEMLQEEMIQQLSRKSYSQDWWLYQLQEWGGWLVRQAINLSNIALHNLHQRWLIFRQRRLRQRDNEDTKKE